MEAPGRAAFLGDPVAFDVSACCVAIAPPTNSTLSLEVSWSSEKLPAFSVLGFVDDGRPPGRADPANAKKIFY